MTKAGFVEVPNRLIARKIKADGRNVIHKKLSYAGRIVLIGLVDYSKNYGYCNYNNSELEDLLGISNISKYIKELEGYKYIKVSELKEENVRSITPRFFYGVTHQQSEYLEKTNLKEYYKEKLTKEGFTPVPKSVIYNKDINYQDRLIYIYLLKLVNNNKKFRECCYPSYASINLMLGLADGSRTIREPLKRLDDIEVNGNKILIRELKSDNRGYYYYPLCRVLKEGNKYKVYFLDEEDLKVREVEKTREELLQEIEDLKKENKRLKELLEQQKEVKDDNGSEELKQNFPTNEDEEEVKEKKTRVVNDEIRIIEHYWDKYEFNISVLSDKHNLSKEQQKELKNQFETLSDIKLYDWLESKIGDKIKEYKID
ncbi:hypothetical protein [Orenia marismortui]|uniref:hypothetical protein n=1 Tax=Orenia marismortui TaxID=46469 RepID=UPI00036E1256|nr:hypothetical protein [Orenia marismortui]